jgi:hypothetical protein
MAAMLKVGAHSKSSALFIRAALKEDAPSKMALTHFDISINFE